MALLGNLTGSSQFFNPSNFYNGVATQSLRFDNGSSAYLHRTPSSASNRKTWTFSGWFKLGVLTIDRAILTSYVDSNTRFSVNLADNDNLYFQNVVGGTRYLLNADSLFRDVSSWYHLVIAVDTTQSTDTNRLKIYINGTQQSLTVVLTGYPTQNQDTLINSTTQQNIGRNSDGPVYHDGYMSEVILVDGQQLDPTYFGKTKNGVWIAKNPVVSDYGTNGFRLQFNQTGTGTASSSTIGADTSGNIIITTSIACCAN